jgi:hypothetical protein
LCKKKKFCFKKDFLFEKRKQKDKRRKIRRKKCAAGRGKSGRGGGNMKGGTVQIAWHGSQPVLSLDFHSPSGLLATAGADHDIKVFAVFCFIFPTLLPDDDDDDDDDDRVGKVIDINIRMGREE